MKSMTREEVFEYLPDEIKWISCRKVGDWWGHWGYTEKPKRTLGKYESEGMFYIPINIAYSGTWEGSLMERPKPKVMWEKRSDYVLLYYWDPEHDESDGEAPPEVAAWFRGVVEETEK